MKAVMLSIHPKWCDLIAGGKKTVEVRKTRPKIETPFKCYIYCTVGGIKKMPKDYLDESFERGKVIGEFICDKIYELAPINHAPDDLEKQSCLTREDIVSYLNGVGFGWHISDLVIYDKLKDLSEFTGLRNTKFGLEPVSLVRPPQSWRYVEDGVFL